VADGKLGIINLFQTRWFQAFSGKS